MTDQGLTDYGWFVRQQDDMARWARAEMAADIARSQQVIRNRRQAAQAAGGTEVINPQENDYAATLAVMEQAVRHHCPQMQDTAFTVAVSFDDSGGNHTISRSCQPAAPAADRTAGEGRAA